MKKTINNAKETLKDLGRIAKNTVATKVNKIKLTNKLNDKLPGAGVMGAKNSNKAYKKIFKAVDKEDYSGAKKYVKSQNKKMGY